LTSWLSIGNASSLSLWVFSTASVPHYCYNAFSVTPATGNTCSSLPPSPFPILLITPFPTLISSRLVLSSKSSAGSAIRCPYSEENARCIAFPFATSQSRSGIDFLLPDLFIPHFPFSGLSYRTNGYRGALLPSDFSTIEERVTPRVFIWLWFLSSCKSTIGLFFFRRPLLRGGSDLLNRYLCQLWRLSSLCRAKMVPSPFFFFSDAARLRSFAFFFPHLDLMAPIPFAMPAHSEACLQLPFKRDL